MSTPRTSAASSLLPDEIENAAAAVAAVVGMEHYNLIYQAIHTGYCAGVVDGIDRSSKVFEAIAQRTDEPRPKGVI